MRTFTLGALAALLLPVSPAAGAVGPGEIDLPESSARVATQVHQLRSSSDRPYTLFAYQVPTEGAVPHILAIDDDDRVWFTESGGQFAKGFLTAPPQGKLGRLDQNGDVSEWSLSTPGSSPMGIAIDAAGSLWIAERLGNQITHIATDGTTTHHAVPTEGAWPTGLAIGPDGRVWFTETKGDRLGVLDPATGAVREIAFPWDAAGATGIAVDEAGRVFVAARDRNTILRFDPETEQFRQYRVPTPESKPCGVTVAKGQVWFSERNGNKIGRIDLDGSIREYTVSPGHSGPFIIAVDEEGGVWFSQIFTDSIGRLDPSSGAVEVFEIPGERVNPAGIALDSKGNVWFAGQASNELGVLVRTDLSYGLEKRPAGAPPAGRAGGSELPSHWFSELEVPTATSIPGIVAVDTAGTVWFTEMGGGWVGPGFPPGPPGSKVGLVRDGKVRELATPTPESGPTSLALDPCGPDVWFTERRANRIARIRDDEITEYEIPLGHDSEPVGIALDLDHDVWVALSKADAIGRMTPRGVWSFARLPGEGLEPRTVFVDRNDQVWFSEKTGNHIGRVDKKTMAVERWEIPTRMAWPLSIVDAPDGKIWFAQMRSDKLGVFDPETEQFAEHAMPVQSAPFKIVYDEEEGAVWVSTVFYNAILRFDLDAKRVTEVYEVPSQGAWVGGLDLDGDRCIWFSEQFANRIGRLCIAGVSRAGLELVQD